MVIPAWYSDDLSKEMQELSVEADKLIPAITADVGSAVCPLQISRGEQALFCWQELLLRLALFCVQRITMVDTKFRSMIIFTGKVSSLSYGSW